MENINLGKLKSFLNGKRITPYDASLALGKDPVYISRVLSGEEEMTATEIKLFCFVYNCTEKDICWENCAKEDYQFFANFCGDRVYVKMLDADGTVLTSGFGDIHWSSYDTGDCAVAQAFSYAAHMAYKHLQCDTVFLAAN